MECNQIRWPREPFENWVVSISCISPRISQGIHNRVKMSRGHLSYEENCIIGEDRAQKLIRKGVILERIALFSMNYVFSVCVLLFEGGLGLLFVPKSFWNHKDVIP